MYGNGAGTGLQIVMTQQQKVEATQLVLRLGLAASTAVVGSDGCAVSYRYGSNPYSRNNNLGFRVVRASSRD